MKVMEDIFKKITDNFEFHDKLYAMSENVWSVYGDSYAQHKTSANRIAEKFNEIKQ